MYLQQSLAHISDMPQQSFDHIIEKYVEMNVPTRSAKATGVLHAHGST